ncbi:MAG: hypothetical protein RIR11_3401 [Bacteroidota bacterium]|jgi:hypothetical protein
MPLNILQNPSFEDIAPNCLPLVGSPVNGAFNQGCVNGWSAANTSPSICFPAAQQGNNFACLGNNTEAIFQNLTICQNERYQIGFWHRGGSFDVYMARGLTNVNINDPLAFPINPLWQLVANVPQSVDINIWQFTQLPIFTANDLANNQLLLRATGADFFLDNMSMVCISQLTPQITFSNQGGGLFNFNGATIAVPPLAVTNWCWDFGDGTPVQSGPNLTNPSHTYATGGNYRVCLTIQDNCCFCLNTTCTRIEVDPCACGQNPQILNTGNVVNWTGITQDINNDVIIAPGTDLLVTSSTLNIKSPCKFVVMRGASMEIRSSTLQSACNGNKWGGIVVWGNSSIDHSNPPAGTIFDFLNPTNNSSNAPGVLLTKQQSTIRDMNINGVFAQRLASDPNAAIYTGITNIPFNPMTDLVSFTGGLVRSTSTTFIDNDLCADFRDYPFNNFSQFGSCTFTTTAAPAEVSNVGSDGVRIFNTDNISFQNCNFDHVGARGIVSVNGSLTMTRCTVNQHYQGLRVTSAAGQTGFVKVGVGSDQQRNTFTDNRFGIWSDGIFNLDVSTNTFSNNGDFVSSGPFGFLEGGGIFVTGPSSFDILDNDFSANISGAELLNTSGGGITGPNQQFKCNIHTNDRIGMLVRGRCPGMFFKDNAFDNSVADLSVQRHTLTTPGEIHLNQGQSNAAIYNYFSPNSADIISSTAPGRTVSFNYFPPLTESTVEFELTAPDCDINGTGQPVGILCSTLNNFVNRPRTAGVKDPCLPPLPRRGYAPCTDKNCLDALRTQKQSLEQMVNSNPSQYKSELAAVNLRFDTDKRDLVWNWYEQGNMARVVQLLTEYGTTEDLQMLYGYYTRARNYTAATTLLESLPSTNENDTWFKEVQRIYLKYATSSGLYTATSTEDQLLQLVATTASTPGSQARAVYYLLHGVWLEPIIDRSEDIGATKEREERLIQDGLPKLSIAPNPATEMIMITVTNTDGGDICIMDLQGILVQRMALQGMTIQCSTSGMPNGMYIVHHVNSFGKTLASQKLVVQH